jgi:hypothetical protein
MKLLDARQAKVPRDRWGRPLIVPPGGGERVPYRRVTTVANVMDNRYALEGWLQRCVAVGLVDRFDLYTLIASQSPTIDDKAIDETVQEAVEASKAHERANLGTALHRFCERIDRGEEDVFVPPPFDLDVAAYRAATEGWQWLVIEDLIVLDGIGVAGSPDRIGIAPDGRVLVADLKTGRGDDDTGDLEWGWAKMLAQVALYARGQFVYDQATDERLPMPDGLDLTAGVIIHLPAGEGRCSLWEIDLVKGWHYVGLALDMLEARNNWRALRRPYEPVVDDLEAQLQASLDAVAARQGSDEHERALQGPVSDETGNGQHSTADNPRRAVRAILANRDQHDADEGEDLDKVTLQALEARFALLDPAAREWVTLVKRSAMVADVSPSRLNLSVRPTVKRFEVARALVRLCEIGENYDEVVRAALHTAAPDLASDDVPVGAALALLSLEEAKHFAQVVDLLDRKGN